MMRIFGAVVIMAVLGLVSGVVIAHVDDDDKRKK